MNTDELISEAKALPVDQRLLLTESLLESLNPPDMKIDSLWIEEAQSRLDDLRTGKVKAVSGSEVFSKVEDLLK